ncbi:MAG TPA: neutral/alkaline non-lysosomal ceramidase N-terminal domain-containing protein, partial [Pirellulales bacterium]|nr:neutral/alkaline non-lysosomal ceramidase N-terminal domain-containing protein [Pirellulales bacterium]
MHRSLIALAVLLIGSPLSAQTNATPPPRLAWKAGAARVVITPKHDMWMAGYAARKKGSEGVAQDLFAKALALQDEQGGRFVAVTMDLISIKREVRDAVTRRCQESYHVPPERVLFNASHTHCGPEYRSRGPERAKEGEQYQAFLENSLFAVIGQALDRLAPASLSFAQARCGFAMNRRRQTSDRGFINSSTFDGPVDHAVPVLAVRDAEQKPVAILFGYACHNTTLSSVTPRSQPPRYMFNGDYAGFAQQVLEETYPGAVAMFMNGCSADQNPYPRNDEVPGKLPLEMAAHHGRSLAYSAVAALGNVPLPVEGTIAAAIDDVELQRNHDKGTHQYTVQIAQLGKQLTLIALSSETVVDYSLRLKHEIKAPALWVAGYSNDMVGYVPSRRVAIEGGYEAQNDYALDVEERIVAKVHEV